MYSRIISAALVGIDAASVSVEADVSDGLPGFAMVGYLAGEVREAQDRVRTAIRTLGESLPPKRITVNLSPADLRKEGSAFDLPIAIAVLCAAGLLPPHCADGILMAGELGLNGQLRPVRGILQVVMAAAHFGCRTCIVPLDNLAEGAVIHDVKVMGAGSLADVVRYLKGEGQLAAQVTDIEDIRRKQRRKNHADFHEIRGQETLRRAAEIAVAGFHNLYMIGPPGSGKSMLARCLPSILPEPSEQEVLEITRIYSIAGLLPEEGLQTGRPFRAPHHTASQSALAGGGRRPKPGEISLAHRGVLFLDELPEFDRNTIEILRQPMEEGQITISRSGGSCTYPARFILVGAANPCPCGYYPDRSRCRCSEREVRRYMDSLSQPLLDRMDICVHAREQSYEDLNGPQGECSADICRRVEQAAQIQYERSRHMTYSFNGEMPLHAALEACALGSREEALVRKIYEELSLTGRSYLKLLRIARTIADLAGEERVREEHLAEAALYRLPGGERV